MALYASILTGGVNNHTTTSEEANYVATDFVTNGIVGAIANTSGVAPATGGFACNAQGTPDMTIAVTAGAAWVTGTPSGQNSQTFRATLSANQNVTIAANSSGSTKYDWVYIKFDPTNGAAPNLAGDNVFTLTTSRSSSATTDNGTPPTYGYCIAVVTVANGASSITNGNIADKRVQVAIGAQNTSVSTGWNTTRNSVVLPTPNTVTYNGNRSYDLVFNSTDLTGYISPGMRLRTSRTVAAPTQCTSLNGTTQYWVKTTPSGTISSITNNITVNAWVKLTAYAAGDVVSKFNGTSGFRMLVAADGTVRLQGFNAGAGNYRYVTTYQSLPLNKWVHISASLDMSGWTTSTNKIMFDGVDLPVQLLQAGTNPTAFINAGNLEIGSENGGTTLLSGKVAQVWIGNGNVSTITQGTIRGYITQGASGSETNCIFAVSFNNSTNDLTANGNNLVAGAGSPTATNADSPFTQDANSTPGGTYDYAIVQKAVFSTNTTLTVQVPEGCAIPTSGGVSAVAYSSVKAPFGMPVDVFRWEVISLYKAAASQLSPSASVWYNMASAQLSVPVGQWQLGYQGMVAADKSTTTLIHVTATLSTTNNSETDLDYTVTNQIQGASGTLEANVTSPRYKGINLTTTTPYYLNGLTGVASVFSLYLRPTTRIAAIPSNL